MPSVLTRPTSIFAPVALPRSVLGGFVGGVVSPEAVVAPVEVGVVAGGLEAAVVPLELLHAPATSARTVRPAAIETARRGRYRTRGADWLSDGFIVFPQFSDVGNADVCVLAE